MFILFLLSLRPSNTRSAFKKRKQAFPCAMNMTWGDVSKKLFEQCLLTGLQVDMRQREWKEFLFEATSSDMCHCMIWDMEKIKWACKNKTQRTFSFKIVIEPVHRNDQHTLYLVKQIKLSKRLHLQKLYDISKTCIGSKIQLNYVDLYCIFW